MAFSDATTNRPVWFATVSVLMQADVRLQCHQSVHRIPLGPGTARGLRGGLQTANDEQHGLKVGTDSYKGKALF